MRSTPVDNVAKADAHVGGALADVEMGAFVVGNDFEIVGRGVCELFGGPAAEP
jgi:pyrimidine deaminase RibD-like protein